MAVAAAIAAAANQHPNTATDQRIEKRWRYWQCRRDRAYSSSLRKCRVSPPGGPLEAAAPEVRRLDKVRAIDGGGADPHCGRFEGHGRCTNPLRHGASGPRRFKRPEESGRQAVGTVRHWVPWQFVRSFQTGRRMMWTTDIFGLQFTFGIYEGTGLSCSNCSRNCTFLLRITQCVYVYTWMAEIN